MSENEEILFLLDSSIDRYERFAQQKPYAVLCSPNFYNCLIDTFKKIYKYEVLPITYKGIILEKCYSIPDDICSYCVNENLYNDYLASLENTLPDDCEIIKIVN